MKTSIVNIFKNKNNKNLILNIAGTIGIKGVAMCFTLFSMPAYMQYFENDIALGVWFSLVSILNWIITFDLGIGNGLRNQLVPELHNGNTEKIKKLISSAYFMLGALSFVVCLAGLVVIRFIDLNALLNVGTDVIPKDTLFLSVCIVFFAIIIKFFLNTITSIFYAMQKTALPNLITLISSLAVLGFLYVYDTPSVSDKFLALSCFQMISMCLPLLIATIVVFMTVLRKSKPSIKSIDWKIGKSVVGLGGQFFIVQICLMLISSTNEVLISKLSSPADTVEYQVYNRWFFMIITVFSLLIQPMWSSFSQANAEGNFVWIKSIYKKFKLLSLLGSLGAVALAIIFQFVVNIWLGENAIDVKFIYSLCFAALIGITLFINSATCVANALNELRCLIIWTIVGAIVKIPLSVVFVNILGSWIGVLLANVVALLPLVFFQSYESGRKLNNKIKN